MSSILFTISSIIDTPNIPYNYSSIRSIYSKDERFEQTKNTIRSIRENCPDAKIFIAECSNYETNKDQLDYLKANSDFFYNMWDKKELHQYIFGISKTLGAAIMAIEFINYIIINNLNFDNYFIISGRYYLNNNFNFNLYKDAKLLQFRTDNIYTSTVLYKMNYNYLCLFKNYLINNLNPSIGYEEIYRNFCDLYKNELIILVKDCYEGNIAVDGNKI